MSIVWQVRHEAGPHERLVCRGDVQSGEVSDGLRGGVEAVGGVVVA